MLIVSPPTASAITPYASERSWIMFVQVTPPGMIQGPIKIEGVQGLQIGTRLRAIAADNPFEAMLIGLIETTTPDAAAQTVADQFAGPSIHDDWYQPTLELLAYIQEYAQPAIIELLKVTHPTHLPDVPVGIEEMSKLLDVSISTMRRMVKKREIPVIRWGKILRFVPADVFASLRR